MRRAGLAALALALGVVAGGQRASAQTIVVGPRASSMSTIPRALITVPVVADLTASGGASLGSVTARLTWRAGILRFRDAGLGSAGAPVFNADSAAGTLRFALANAGGVTGTPVLINAIFEVTGAAGDTATLSVAVDEMARAGTFASLLPVTTTSAKFCVSTGRWGDLDGNDSLTSFDALLIVTNAVGLPIAPRTTVNGDVDGDGKVDTRDALIVLSAAIGLPTGTFRVGALNSGSCTVRRAASVAIQPASVGVGVGDRLPLAATVRDSSGAIINGQDVVWVSRDTLIARTDATGNAIGVAAGTTRVLVLVAPGVMDSVTVTVSGTRHVWYVDPAVAAGNPVELGSQLYPFSSIQRAVEAAAADDTVRVAVADYGDAVRITRALVVIGDSTAAGFPRIRNGTGPAVSVDSVASGTVRLERLRLQDSQGGVIASGSGTAVLDVRGLIVERSRAAGVSVSGLASVRLEGVTIAGAVDAGVDVAGVPRLALSDLSVDLIVPGTSGLVPAVLRVVGADTLQADGFALRTGEVRLDSVGVVALSRGSVMESPGDGLNVVGGRSVLVENVVVEDYEGDGIIISQADTVVVRGSELRRASVGPWPYCGGQAIGVFDAGHSEVRNNFVTNAECRGIHVVHQTGRAVISRNRVQGAAETGLLVSVPVVELDHNVVRDIGTAVSYAGVAHGIKVERYWDVDSVTSVGDSVANSDYRGFVVDSAGAVVIDSLIMDGTGQDGSDWGNGVELRGVRIRVTHSRLSNIGGVGVGICGDEGAVVFSEGNRIRSTGGDGIAAWGDCWDAGVRSDSVFSARDTVQQSGWVSISAGVARYVRVDSAVLDTVAIYGVWLYDVGHAVVRDSRMRGSGHAGVAVYEYVRRVELLRNSVLESGIVGLLLLLSDMAPSDSARLVGNSIDGAVSAGVYFRGSGRVLVDSSRIARTGHGIEFSAPTLGTVSARVTRSRISNNRAFGVALGWTASSVSLSLWKNNIFANDSAGVVNYATTPPVIDADSNYWGDANGPRCRVGISGCSGLSTSGDSIITQNVAFVPWDSVANPEAPAAPPAAGPRSVGAPARAAQPEPPAMWPEPALRQFPTSSQMGRGLRQPRPSPRAIEPPRTVPRPESEP